MQAVAAAADAEERQDKGERDELTAWDGCCMGGWLERRTYRKRRGAGRFFTDAMFDYHLDARNYTFPQMRASFKRLIWFRQRGR
jgi:hypothetical protein